MQESTCHEIVIELIKSIVWTFSIFWHTFISFINNFHFDSECMIVRTREISIYEGLDGGGSSIHYSLKI